MPHLTFKTSSDGLAVRVLIGLRHTRIQQLRRAGMPIPAPKELRAIFDTGTDVTAVSESSLSHLGMQPVGTELVTTPGGVAIVSRYRISLSLPSEDRSAQLSLPEMDVLTMAHPPIGFDMLIGMDVLADCLLLVDGKARRFTLAF